MIHREVLEGENVVAIFDILGFRALVQATPPSSFHKLLDEVIILSHGGPIDDNMLGSMVLSDTIVLYGRTSELPLDIVTVMVSASNLLNAAARNALPIRGAISGVGLYWV